MHYNMSNKVYGMPVPEGLEKPKPQVRLQEQPKGMSSEIRRTNDPKLYAPYIYS